MPKIVSNIYDFDGTIYDGDASLDFYFYCLRKYPFLVFVAPYQLFHVALFFLRLESRTKVKSKFFIFLKFINNVDDLVEDFWEKNKNKIKKWYLEQKQNSDLIISASPLFLIGPIASILKVKEPVATLVDEKTGKVQGLNCHGEEKVRRLYESFPDIKIGNVYTDSISDLPILKLSKNSYIVNGNSVKKLKI